MDTNDALGSLRYPRARIGRLRGVEAVLVSVRAGEVNQDAGQWSEPERCDPLVFLPGKGNQRTYVDKQTTEFSS